MAESLVNPASAAQLSPRNSEPTHLNTGSHDELGDATDSKLNYAGNLKTDSSIPRSVAAEPTHLKTEDEEDLEKVEDDEDPETVTEADDVEIEFGDEKKDENVDDLDKAIDELASLPVTEIYVTEDDDDDEDKKVDENDDDDNDDKKVNEADDDDDDEKEVNEAEDDEEEEEVNEDDDEKPDFLKKKIDETVNGGRKDKEIDDGGLEVDENDDDEKEVDEDCGDAVDEDDDEEDLKESLKISIKMPKASLFESAGFNVKQQKKVASIFESAIKSTTRQVGKQIHEHYSKVHKRRLAKAQGLIENRLNTYLDVVVEEWVKTNAVPIRTSLRTELSENFLNGLQKLFTEHYIDVPKSKTNVVKSLTHQVETLKRQVNEQYTEKLKLRRLAETANKKRIVATFARDMSESQAGKLEKLAEDTQYVSARDFREKLTMLKESYFEKKPNRAVRLPEENVQEVSEKGGAPKGEADMVAEVITRQAKSSDW
jgi:hypothetical protein